VLVEDLVRLGLVSRVPDAKDRRVIRLALTAKGRQTITTEMKKMEKQMRANLSVLSAKEQEQLASIIEKMYQGLVNV
jgi:DNA-binding MarR family transcriptional regulator